MSASTATTTDAPHAERLINTVEVAKRYGVHPKTLLRFVSEGRVPPPIKTQFSNGLQWRESVVENHLRSQE